MEPAIQLTAIELQAWQTKGFLGPFRLFSDEETRSICASLEADISKTRSPHAGTSLFHRLLYRLKLTQRTESWLHPIRNRHLDLPLAAKICRQPAIVERLAGLLGPDLVLWRTNFFFQNGKENEGLPWHTDQYLMLLAKALTNISVHLALTEATEGNCVLLIPGTHKLTHEELQLKYGLELIPGTDQGKHGNPRYQGKLKDPSVVRKMTLKPGEFFIFDEGLLHASSESLDGAVQPRIGFAMRVTVPSIKVLPAAFSETLPLVHKCVMLRGTDAFKVNEMANWP